MAIERPAGAIGFMFRITMQHDARDFAPIGTYRIRVEQGSGGCGESGAVSLSVAAQVAVTREQAITACPAVWERHR